MCVAIHQDAATRRAGAQKREYVEGGRALGGGKTPRNTIRSCKRTLETVKWLILAANEEASQLGNRGAVIELESAGEQALSFAKHLRQRQSR